MMNGLSGILNIMDSQTLINGLFGILCAVAGWFFRVMWEAQQELQKDLGELEKNLPHTYALKVDYQKDIADIKIMLGKIFDKLDGKADK
jgi:hypothetical protein